jgi:hypothetical protein
MRPHWHHRALPFYAIIMRISLLLLSFATAVLGQNGGGYYAYFCADGRNHPVDNATHRACKNMPGVSFLLNMEPLQG